MGIRPPSGSATSGPLTFTSPAGTGQGIGDGVSFETGGGEIDVIYTPTIGHRIRLNDDTASGGGKVIGIRYQRDRVNMWDLDIEASTGRWFLDDISVNPSWAAIIAEPGQVGHGVTIKPQEVVMQRQFSLADLSDGGTGVKMQYSNAEGLKWYDTTRVGPPAILQATVGAAGGFYLTPGTGGVHVQESMFFDNPADSAVGVQLRYVTGTGWDLYDQTQVGPVRLQRVTLGAAGKFLITPGTGGFEISGDGANNTGIRLTNTNTSQTWRVGAIEEGVNHSRFTIRDVSNTRDMVCLDNNGAVLLYLGGAMKQVEVGAVDSGGAGYRMLRVAN